jgi:hypothetical protein
MFRSVTSLLVPTTLSYLSSRVVGWACGEPKGMKMFRFSNLCPPTHHPFLVVIPSAAEGPAVRPSPSRKPRITALPL